MLPAILMLFELTVASHHRYHLDQAKNTWQGLGHALHYKDHFKFLNVLSSNLTGVMTTKYKLKADKEFHLSFGLTISGDRNTEEDGFVIMLSKQPFDKSYLEYNEFTPLGYRTKFHESTSHIDIQGYFIMFTGGNDRSVYTGYSEDEIPVTKNHVWSCQGTYEPKMNFIIKLFNNMLTMSVDTHDGDGYLPCHDYDVKDWVGEFYVTIITRSGVTSKTDFDVTEMTFTSDVENINIGEFKDTHRSRDHHLFHHIHFIRHNHDLLVDPKFDVPKKKLNLTVVAKLQDSIHHHLEHANRFMERNMEVSQKVIDYIQLQNSAVFKYAEDVIQSIHSLVNNTVTKFTAIERDSNFIIREYQEFNLDGEFRSAIAAVDQLHQRLADSLQRLRVFQDHDEQTVKNLEYLKSHESELKALPQRFQEYLAAIKRHDSKSAQLRLLVVVFSAGVIAISALSAVLWRLRGGNTVGSESNKQ